VRTTRTDGRSEHESLSEHQVTEIIPLANRRPAKECPYDTLRTNGDEREEWVSSLTCGKTVFCHLLRKALKNWGLYSCRPTQLAQSAGYPFRSERSELLNRGWLFNYRGTDIGENSRNNPYTGSFSHGPPHIHLLH